MNELLEKAYNCYLIYLDKLNYGNVNQEYCLVYDAILAISNNITDEKYRQYFVNNLLCPTKYPLTITSEMNKMIMWTLNSSSNILNNFNWNNISPTGKNLYEFTTNSVPGFNFLYLSIPEDVSFIVMNELNMVIQNNLKSAGDVNQLFIFIGTSTVNGKINNIWRKKDVFNSLNKVSFKIQTI